MENPESITALLKLAEPYCVRSDFDELVFGPDNLLKFSEKISEQVFLGTCNMIIAVIAQMVKEVGQEVALAKSVTEGELDGTSRTGSH